MAIIECPECAKQVSDSAEACPNCGFAVKTYVQKQQAIERIKKESEREAISYVEKKMAEKATAKKRAEEERILQKNRSYDKAVELFNKHTVKEVKESEYLFLSIKDWRDSKNYLEIIDDRIEDVRLEEAQKQKRRKRIKCIIIPTISLIVVAVVVVSIFAFIIPSTKKTNSLSQQNENQPTIKPTQYPTQKATQIATEKATQTPTEKPTEFYSIYQPEGQPISIEDELGKIRDNEGLYYSHSGEDEYVFTIKQNLIYDICIEHGAALTLLYQGYAPIKPKDDGYYQVIYDGKKFYDITFTFYKNGVTIDGLDKDDCNGFYYYGGIAVLG